MSSRGHGVTGLRIPVKEEERGLVSHHDRCRMDQRTFVGKMLVEGVMVISAKALQDARIAEEGSGLRGTYFCAYGS